MTEMELPVTLEPTAYEYLISQMTEMAAEMRRRAAALDDFVSRFPAYEKMTASDQLGIMVNVPGKVTDLVRHTVARTMTDGSDVTLAAARLPDLRNLSKMVAAAREERFDF